MTRYDWLCVFVLGFPVGLGAMFPDRLNVVWPAVLIYLGGIFFALAVKDHSIFAQERRDVNLSLD